MSDFSLKLSKLIPQPIERRIRLFRDLYLRRMQQSPLPKEIFNDELDKKSISFCTTCMNRLFHLRHTIRQNIIDNRDYPNVEFVLLNYNSQDGLHEWVKKHLQSFIDEGVLNYYATFEPASFHASIAKNIAHKVAKGQILCNLDGDNFTGRGFAYFINYQYKLHGMNTILHFHKAPYWGTEGRIVYPMNKFLELGGHDESLLPTGHEDHDLLNRAKAFGMKYVEIDTENFLKYLSNTTKEKSSNFEDKDAYYYDYESANRKTSNKNIANGILRANEGKKWGEIKLLKNFSEEIQFPDSMAPMS